MFDLDKEAMNLSLRRNTLLGTTNVNWQKVKFSTNWKYENDISFCRGCSIFYGIVCSFISNTQQPITKQCCENDKIEICTNEHMKVLEQFSRWSNIAFEQPLVAHSSRSRTIDSISCCFIGCVCKGMISRLDAALTEVATDLESRTQLRNDFSRTRSWSQKRPVVSLLWRSVLLSVKKMGYGLLCGLWVWRRKQTVDHVVLQGPIHLPPHWLHDLTVLDDETTEWLINTCPRSNAAKQWFEQLAQKKKTSVISLFRSENLTLAINLLMSIAKMKVFGLTSDSP